MTVADGGPENPIPSEAELQMWRAHGDSVISSQLPRLAPFSAPFPLL